MGLNAHFGWQQSSGIECPLWVKSRHCSTSAQCPLYPQKRTSELTRVMMSALCQKRTFTTSIVGVRNYCRGCTHESTAGRSETACSDECGVLPSARLLR